MANNQNKPFAMRGILRNQIPPCSDCPFRLGKVQLFASPCPNCKQDNDYEMYRIMKKKEEERSHGNRTKNIENA